ncbi:hypothetical protein JCM8547_000325 [Rhodosporidiobolus lusitaniae]
MYRVSPVSQVARMATRSLHSTPLLLAQTPHHDSPHKAAVGGDVKPTEWVNRRVQGKSASVISPWFIVLGTLGAAAAWRYLGPGDEETNASFRGGTVPPPEIGGDGKAGTPPTYQGVEKK